MTADDRLKRSMIESMVKQLPPSASLLRLLDVNGEAGEILSDLREDLEIITVSGDVTAWRLEENSVDAVVAYAYVLNDPFLSRVLDAMRPGGRLILVDPRGAVRKAYVDTLEASGYARILVESALNDSEPIGVLIRGEKPHTTSDTLERIQSVAGQDDDRIDLAGFRGRYVHLLVQETPNKPVWARKPDETIFWKAAAIDLNGDTTLLAFSSLPKGVSFMQPAVLAGNIQDVNKVGKFRKDVAVNWSNPIILNPDLTVFEQGTLVWLDIDPASAEAPDE